MPPTGTNRVVSVNAGGIQINAIGNNVTVENSQILRAQDDLIAGYSAAVAKVAQDQPAEPPDVLTLDGAAPAAQAQVFFVNAASALPIGTPPTGTAFTAMAPTGTTDQVQLSPPPTAQQRGLMAGAFMFDVSTAARGSGLLVSGNVIANSLLARGVALSGMSGVRVAGNTITGTQQAGILLNNSLFGKEDFGPSSGDAITDNTLMQTNMGLAGIGSGMLGTIEVVTISGLGRVVGTEPNFTITITGNKTSDTPRSGIWLQNIASGTVSDNAIACTGQNPAVGEHPTLPTGLRLPSDYKTNPAAVVRAFMRPISVMSSTMLFTGNTYQAACP